MSKFVLSITLSFLLASIAYFKKSLTKSALLLAFIFSYLITYYGGIASFIILVTVFLGSNIGKLFKKTKSKDEIIAKSGQKDTIQILANVGLGTLSIIIYGLTGKFSFLVIYASIMAESLSDTLASDIGMHSKHKPINILTFKESTPGLSGNISTLGLISSFLGAFIISIIFYIFHHSVLYLIIIISTGFLGSLIDSILGSLIQVKYECPKCHIITEKKSHCNKPTRYHKGLRGVNNDTINLLSNLFAGILSFVLMLLLHAI